MRNKTGIATRDNINVETKKRSEWNIGLVKI